MERIPQSDDEIEQLQTDKFTRCIDFLCGFAERRAARVTRLDFGFAVFDDALPLAWDLNSLWVTGHAYARVGELAAEADRLQGSAGLSHRRLMVVTGHATELASGFVSLGWEAKTLLVMPRVTIGVRPADEIEVVELHSSDIEPLWVEGISRAPGAEGETVRQLVRAQHARRRAALVRYFGVVINGRIASTCELFSHESISQVESVMTVEDHRGRGLARAVVAHAAAQAVAGGAELVFLLADEADWPQTLYRKVGFEAVGRIMEITRPPS